MTYSVVCGKLVRGGRSVSVCLVGIALFAGRAESGVVLVDGGLPRAALITASTEGEQDRRMVREASRILVEHIRQMSGAELPVRQEAAADLAVRDGQVVREARGPDADVDTFILVGESDTTRALGVSNAEVGHGGLRVVTRGNALVLLGPWDGTAYTGGTLYAVVRFLEHLGCRFLWPGESGKVVPRLTTITVGELDIRYTPRIGQRHIRFMGEGPRNFDSGLAQLVIPRKDYTTCRAEALRTEAYDGGWARWQRLGGSIGIRGGAAGAGLRGGWDEHGEEHPEWFALQKDGTRDQSAAGARWRLCVSSTGLVAHVAGDVIQRVTEDPALTCVSLCPNDGGYSSFCMCDDCRALDPPDAPTISLLRFEKVGESARTSVEYPSLTDRYVHYWNAVAARVTAVHPELLLLVEAYSTYKLPPVRETLHPNLVLRYVPGGTDGWVGWQKAGAQRIYWRPNNLHSGYRDGGLNNLRARSLAETTAALAGRGMLATDIQGIYDFWATMGLNYYVVTRMIWNPDLTYDTILDDTCRTGFGLAAASIKAYFRRAEELAGSPTNFTGVAAEELRGLLNDAEDAAAADEGVRKRIAFLRDGLEHTILSGQAYLMRDDLARGGDTTRETLHALLERRWRLMRRVAIENPLAVNMPLVAGNESHIWSRLGWSGPSDETQRDAGLLPTLDDSSQDDWLFEEQ